MRRGMLTVSFASVSGAGGGAGQTEVGLYDVSGRLVRWIARGSYPAGIHTALWDGSNEDGRPVPAGVYFLRLTTGREQETKKVTVVR